MGFTSSGNVPNGVEPTVRTHDGHTPRTNPRLRFFGDEVDPQSFDTGEPPRGSFSGSVVHWWSATREQQRDRIRVAGNQYLQLRCTRSGTHESGTRTRLPPVWRTANVLPHCEHEPPPRTQDQMAVPRLRLQVRPDRRRHRLERQRVNECFDSRPDRFTGVYVCVRSALDEATHSRHAGSDSSSARVGLVDSGHPVPHAQ